MSHYVTMPDLQTQWWCTTSSPAFLCACLCVDRYGKFILSFPYFNL